MRSTKHQMTAFALVGGPIIVVVVCGASLFVWKQVCSGSLSPAQKDAVALLSDIRPQRFWQAGASVEYDRSRQLTSVNLMHTQVTDADLAALTALDSTEWLNLQQTQISDAGLVRVRSLTNLKSLGLNNTRATDAGLEQLSNLGQLERLYLNDSLVTDAGLAHIAALPQLRELYLRRTRITDEGLSKLSNLSHLQILAVSETDVTEEGIKRFLGRLPDCKVYR